MIRRNASDSSMNSMRVWYSSTRWWLQIQGCRLGASSNRDTGGSWGLTAFASLRMPRRYGSKRVSRTTRKALLSNFWRSAVFLLGEENYASKERQLIQQVERPERANDSNWTGRSVRRRVERTRLSSGSSG